MSGPAVCGFTNLAIEQGDPVAFMLVVGKIAYNPPWMPFDLYGPASPFIRGVYHEDEFLIFDKGEEEKFRGYIEHLDGPIDIDYLSSIHGQSERPYFPYLIREDALDLCYEITYHDCHAYHPIRTAVLEKRNKINAEIDRILQYDSFGIGNAIPSIAATFLRPELNISEGQNNPAVYGIIERLKALKPGCDINDIKTILEPFFDIYCLWAAMANSGRILTPSKIRGPQTLTDAHNQLMITEYMKSIATRQKAEAASMGYK